MIVREATTGDWPTAAEFFLSTPLESGTVFVLDRRPDFGALPGLRGVFRTFLAFEGERLAGTVTALCRKAKERDQVVIVGEVIDFRVAAWARGGRAAFLLLRAAYEAFRAYGVDWFGCLIGDQNRATLPLVARRAGFPNLVALAGFASVHFIAWRVPSLSEPNGLTVRAATAADAATVAELSAEAFAHELLAPTNPIEWPDAAGLHRAWIASAPDGDAVRHAACLGRRNSAPPSSSSLSDGRPATSMRHARGSVAGHRIPAAIHRWCARSLGVACRGNQARRFCYSPRALESGAAGWRRRGAERRAGESTRTRSSASRTPQLPQFHLPFDAVRLSLPRRRCGPFFPGASVTMPTSRAPDGASPSIPYGGRLMFTQSWEDPACDLAALRPQRGDTILAITSGGDNVLGLLLTDARRSSPST